MFDFIQNQLTKRVLVIILIIATVHMAGGFALFLPQKAQAALPVIDIKGAAKWIWQKTQWAWEKGKWVVETAANKITATIKLWEQSESIAAQITFLLAELALRRLLAILTNDIIAWVQSGYSGKPAFMEGNFGDVLAEVAVSTGGDFITQFLGAEWLCEPFQFNFKIPLLDEYTFDEKAQCTLSDMGRNLKNFADDFRNGGWTEWFQLTQPQNNVYGAYYLALTELDKEKETAKEEMDRDLAFGEGFLSMKNCTWFDKDSGKTIKKQEKVVGKPPLPEECKPANLKAAGLKGPCDYACKVVTPGSIVKDVTQKNITQSMDRLNMTLANLAGKAGGFFKPYIMAIGDAMVNQIITDGLAELKEAFGPSSSKPDAPLLPGEQLPESEKLPNFINNESIETQTLLENLSVLERDSTELYIAQTKIINLFKREDKDLISWPTDFITSFDVLLPILGKVKNWIDVCAPSAYPKRLEGDYYTNPLYTKFWRNVNNYLVRLIGRDNIVFDKLDEQRISVDQIIAADSVTSIEKTGTAYSFSVKDMIDDGMITLIDTKETIVETSAGETITTDSIPPEHYYDFIDWFVKIENIDVVTRSASQEVVDHTQQITTNFFDSLEVNKTNLENIRPAIANAVFHLKRYINAAEAYLEFYQNNVADIDFNNVAQIKETYKTNPNSLDVINPFNNTSLDAQFAALEIALVSPDYLDNYRDNAIKAVQQVGQPNNFTSATFEDLSSDVQNLVQIFVDENGKLSELLGDEDYSSNADLYGFIDTLERYITYAVPLHHMCTTGTLP